MIRSRLFGHEAVGQRDEAAARPRPQFPDRGLDVVLARDLRRLELQLERPRGVLGVAHEDRRERRGFRIVDQRDARDLRRDRLEQLQPFAADAGLEIRESGDVAARPRHALHQARLRSARRRRRTRSASLVISLRTASVPGVVRVTITSGLSSASSRAAARMRSVSKPGQRYSIFRLRPSIQPSAARPSRNATISAWPGRIARRQADQHADAVDRAGRLRADCGRRPRRRGERGSEQRDKSGGGASEMAPDLRQAWAHCRDEGSCRKGRQPAVPGAACTTYCRLKV